MIDSRLGPLVGPEGHDPAWDDRRPDMYRDRNGDPMSLREWATGIENPNYRFVAQDEVNGVKVITVWHGMADPFDEDQLFGTIYWSATAGFYDECLTATEAEALAEHQRRLDLLRASG